MTLKCAMFTKNFLLLLIFIILISQNLQQAKAQDLVAGVSIADGQNSINQKAIYRFTLIPEQLSFDAGTIIKTYIPSTVTPQLTSSNQLEICRRYIKLTSSTSSLSCSYSSSDVMVQFTIQSTITFDVAYEYDVGYLQNPSVSSLVSGFRIVIESQSGQTLYESTIDTSAVFIQPGNLTGQSLSISSYKVSDSCTYTFSFQISNSIPGDGLIQINFPYNDIDVPATLSSSDTRVKIYDKDWKTGSVTVTTRYVIFNNAFGGSAVSADSSKYIRIEIKNVVNPRSLKESSSFSISTSNSQYSKIDQVSSGLTVQPTIPGDITVYSVAPQTNSQVGQTTDINFNILLAQTYESGGYLLITLPTEVTLRSLTCYPFIGFVTQESNCAINSTNPTVVKISNSISSTRLYFLITTIQNPSSTKPTSTFKIQAYDSSDYLMSQILSGVTYTATPATLRSVTSVRGLTEISIIASNNLTIQFTTTNSLSSGEQFFIKIPYDQQLVDASSFACMTKTSTTSTYSSAACSLDTTSNSTYFSFSLPSPCSSGCAATTTFQVLVTGIRNPYWKVSPVTKTIEVYTMTSDLLYQKDRRITSIFTTSELKEGGLYSMSITRSLFVVNSETQLTVNFTTLNNVPAGGYIRLYLSANSFYTPLTGSVVCTDLLMGSTLTCTAVNFTDSTKGIDYIHITNKCSTQCSARTSMSFRFSNLRNRKSVKSLTNAFAIRTCTSEGYNIDLGNITNATNMQLVTQNFTTLQMTSPQSPIITGSLSSYVFKISTLNGIPASTGLLEIYLPNELSINSQVNLNAACIATVGTQTLTCRLNSTLKRINITHSISGQTFSSQTVTVTVQNAIYNPSSTQPSSFFQVQNQLYDSDTISYYLVDYDYWTLTITADTPNTLQAVSVTRSSTIINEESDFTLFFITVNPIPQNSLIIISFPKDQVIFKSSKDATFYDTTTNNQITEVYKNGVEDSSLQYVSVSLTEWCSSGLTQCSAKTSLTLKVSNVYNPSSTKAPVLSFQIKIQTPEQYFTDQKVQDVFVTPLLSSGPFNDVQISESSTIVGDENTLSITVKINNPVTTGQDGQLSIILPSSIFYTALDSSELLCSTSNQATACSAAKKTDSMGTYYATISINMLCASLSCSSGTSRTFLISNLRNRFSTKPVEGTFYLSSLDSDNLTFDSSSLDYSTTQLEESYKISSKANVLSILRSNSTVLQETNLSVNFQTSVRLPKNSIIQLQIPKSPFSDFKSLKCYNISSLQNVDCQLNTTAQDSQYYVLQFKEFCASTTNLYCPDTQTYPLLIRGFFNRYNTEDSQLSFSMRTYTQEFYQVENSTNSISLSSNLQPTTAIIFSNYSISDIDVGGDTILTLSLTLQNQIQRGESLTVEFSEYLFYSTDQLYCQLTSSFPSKNDPVSIDCDATTLSSTNLLLKKLSFTMPQSAEAKETLTFVISGLSNLLQDKPLAAIVSLQANTSSTVAIAKGSLNVDFSDSLNQASFTFVEATRDNNDIDTNSKFNLTFISPIKILQQSSMLIQVPKSQFIYPGSGLSCSLDQTSCSYTSEDSDYTNITLSNLCSTQDCEANKVQSLIITGFKNPNMIQAVSKSFILYIKSKDNYGIVNSTGIEVIASPPIKIGAFQSLNISQTGSRVTGNVTTYDFQFVFPSTLTNDIELFLKFPQKTISLETTLKCYDQNKNQYYQCSVNTTLNGYISVIQISNYCQISTCDTQTTQSFQIQGIRNVEYARPRSSKWNFEIMAVNANGFVLSSSSLDEGQLLAFEVRKLESLNVTRETTKPGQGGLDLIISFKTLIQIPDGSTFLYTIPYEQVTFASPTNLICLDKQGTVSLNCEILSRNSTFLVIKVKEWCQGDCSVNTTMAMRMKRSINPSSLSANYPSSSFGLLVQTRENYKVQEIYEGVKALPRLDGLFEISNVIISREINVVGEEDYLAFMIPLNDTFAVSVSVQVDFPANISYQPIKNFCLVLKSNELQSRQCYYNYQTNYESYGRKSINQVSIADICTISAPCKANQNLIFKVKVSNPNSQQELKFSSFKITLRQNNDDIASSDILTKLPQLSSNNITASIVQANTSNCDLTGQLCTLQLNITTSNPVPANNGLLQITFPDQLSILTTSKCTAYLFNTQITCTKLSDGVLELRHTQSKLSTSNILSYNFTITLTNIRNPFSTQQTNDFKMSSFIQINKNSFLIDEMRQILNYQVQEPGSFSSVEVVRKNTTIGKSTQINFSLKTDNYIPSNGVLLIQIPESQVILQRNDTINCFSGTSLSSSNQLKCIFVDDNTIQISGLCSKNGCQAYTRLIFILPETLICNPSYYKTTYDSLIDSLIMTTQYEDNNQTYLIQRTSSGIFIKPQLQLNSLAITNLTINSYQTSEISTICFKVTSKNQPITSDYLSIRFDDQIIEKDLYYDLYATINDKQTDVISINQNLTNNELNTLIVACSKQNCQNQNELTITVFNIKNPSFKFKNLNLVDESKFQIFVEELYEGTKD